MVAHSYYLDILLKDENSEGYHYMSTEYGEDFLTSHHSMHGWDEWNNSPPQAVLKDFSTKPYNNELSFWRVITAIKVIIDFAAPNQFMNWTTNPFTQ